MTAKSKFHKVSISASTLPLISGSIRPYSDRKSLQFGSLLSIFSVSSRKVHHSITGYDVVPPKSNQLESLDEFNEDITEIFNVPFSSDTHLKDHIEENSVEIFVCPTLAPEALPVHQSKVDCLSLFLKTKRIIFILANRFSNFQGTRKIHSTEEKGVNLFLIIRFNTVIQKVAIPSIELSPGGEPYHFSTSESSIQALNILHKHAKFLRNHVEELVSKCSYHECDKHENLESLPISSYLVIATSDGILMRFFNYIDSSYRWIKLKLNVVENGEIKWIFSIDDKIARRVSCTCSAKQLLLEAEIILLESCSIHMNRYNFNNEHTLNSQETKTSDECRMYQAKEMNLTIDGLITCQDSNECQNLKIVDILSRIELECGIYATSLLSGYVLHSFETIISEKQEADVMGYIDDNGIYPSIIAPEGYVSTLNQIDSASGQIKIFSSNEDSNTESGKVSDIKLPLIQIDKNINDVNSENISCSSTQRLKWVPPSYEEYSTQSTEHGCSSPDLYEPKELSSTLLSLVSIESQLYNPDFCREVCTGCSITKYMTLLNIVRNTVTKSEDMYKVIVTEMKIRISKLWKERNIDIEKAIALEFKECMIELVQYSEEMMIKFFTAELRSMSMFTKNILTIMSNKSSLKIHRFLYWLACKCTIENILLLSAMMSHCENNQLSNTSRNELRHGSILMEIHKTIEIFIDGKLTNFGLHKLIGPVLIEMIRLLLFLSEEIEFNIEESPTISKICFSLVSLVEYLVHRCFKNIIAKNESINKASIRNELLTETRCDEKVESFEYCIYNYHLQRIKSSVDAEISGETINISNEIKSIVTNITDSVPYKFYEIHETYASSENAIKSTTKNQLQHDSEVIISNAMQLLNLILCRIHECGANRKNIEKINVLKSLESLFKHGGIDIAMLYDKPSENGVDCEAKFFLWNTLTTFYMICSKFKLTDSISRPQYEKIAVYHMSQFRYSFENVQNISNRVYVCLMHLKVILALRLIGSNEINNTIYVSDFVLYLLNIFDALNSSYDYSRAFVFKTSSEDTAQSTIILNKVPALECRNKSSNYENEDFSTTGSDSSSDKEVLYQCNKSSKFVIQQDNLALAKNQSNTNISVPAICFNSVLNCSNAVGLLESASVPLLSKTIVISDEKNRKVRNRPPSKPPSMHQVRLSKSRAAHRNQGAQTSTGKHPCIEITENDNYEAISDRKYLIQQDMHVHLIIFIVTFIESQREKEFGSTFNAANPFPKICNILQTLQQHIENQCSKRVCKKLLSNNLLGSNYTTETLVRLIVPSNHSYSSESLEKMIGSGQFGTVSEVSQTTKKMTQSRSAVKRIPIHRVSVHDVINEVVAMRRLKGYIEICQLYDFGIDGDQYYLVMECCQCTLNQWRKNQTCEGNNVAFYLEIFKQILIGVVAIADLYILHLDLKCDNILIRKEFGQSHDQCTNVCISDFGEAIIGVEHDKHNYTFEVSRARGTECIQSPEMLSLHANNKVQPCHKIGLASDVWSLGCLFYEFLTGRYLFNCIDFPEFFVRLLPNKYAEESKISIFPEGSLEQIPGPEKVTNILINFLQFILVRDSDDRPSAQEVLIQLEVTSNLVNKSFRRNA